MQHHDFGSKSGPVTVRSRALTLTQTLTLTLTLFKPHNNPNLDPNSPRQTSSPRLRVLHLQDRASPKLHEALRYAARATQLAAATTPPAAAATPAQPLQQPPPPSSGVATTAAQPPTDAFRTPFMDSPSPAKAAGSGMLPPSATSEPPSSEAAVPVSAGDRADWPTRQASLMGAWLGPVQAAGTTAPPGDPDPGGTVAPDPDGAPEAHQPADPVATDPGLSGRFSADVCEQQAELQPFRRSSLPEAVTPRLSLTASWPPVAGLDFVGIAPSSEPAGTSSGGDGRIAAGLQTIKATGSGAGKV
jgi:hypothetical protein